MTGIEDGFVQVAIPASRSDIELGEALLARQIGQTAKRGSVERSRAIQSHCAATMCASSRSARAGMSIAADLAVRPVVIREEARQFHAAIVN